MHFRKAESSVGVNVAVCPPVGKTATECVCDLGDTTYGIFYHQLVSGKEGKVELIEMLLFVPFHLCIFTSL